MWPLWMAAALICACAKPSAGYSEPAQTPCQREAARPPIPGRPGPRCDASGAYSAQQCRGSVCYCVDHRNQQLGEYETVGRHEAHTVSCGCARQKSDQGGRELERHVTCDRRGNFEKRQCSSSQCYCVDLLTGALRDEIRLVDVRQASSLDCDGGGGYDGGGHGGRGGGGHGGGGGGSGGHGGGGGGHGGGGGGHGGRGGRGGGHGGRGGGHGGRGGRGGHGGHGGHGGSGDQRERGTPCWEELRRHESRLAQGLLGSTRPDCDRSGQFRPRQCTGSECYCVAADGRRLTEYQPVPRGTRHFCGCASRRHQIAESGLVGVLLLCDDHGDYSARQCTGSVCRCVDTVTGERRHGGRQVAVHALDSLDCGQHQTPEKPLLGGKTPCWDELRSFEAIQTPLLGAQKPRCDRIGRYHPRQCKGSECFCADPYGGAIGTYRKTRGAAAELMSCLCARREWELHSTGLIGLSVNCDEHGNFAPQQCVGSVCHCVVVVTGEKLPGSETAIGSLSELDCSRHQRRLLGGDRPCEERLRQMRRRLAGAAPPPGYEEPECDRSGAFEPRQCSGSQCYCVAADGEQLEGYSQPRQHRDKMNCLCARKAWKISKDGLGPRLTCDRFGSFHHTQCEGSTCFCVDPTSGELVGGQSTHVSRLAALGCGARLLGADTPCWAERRRLEQRQQSSPYPLVGAEPPECDRSGQYAPKQCRGSQCFCVDERGAQLDEYSTDRWQADAMKCVCTRRQQEISSHGLLGVSATCDRLGNFERRQCSGSQCYCVNPHTGAQVDVATVHVSQSAELDCQRLSGGSGSGHSGGGSGHSGGGSGHSSGGSGHSGGGSGHSGGGSGHSGGGSGHSGGGSGHSGSGSGHSSGGSGHSGGGSGHSGGGSGHSGGGSGHSGGGSGHSGGGSGHSDHSHFGGGYGHGHSLLGGGACWEERTRVMQQMDTGGGHVPGSSLPDCDRTGRYAPKQCMGSKCSCVDPQGNNVPGYQRNIWDAHDMHCRCVRRQLEGVTVKCNELGNYHSHQCADGRCYCVDHLTGERQPSTQSVLESEVAQLESQCAPLGSNHKCWDDRRRTDEAGRGRLGAPRPACDIHGQYSAKQCQGSKCQCVDINNEPLGVLAHVRHSATMHCQCARRRWELSRHSQQRPRLTLPQCDNLGNYKVRQCSDEDCYEVDPVTGARAAPSAGRSCEAAARRLAGSGRQPQCAADGSFLARQCHAGTCFCAGTDGRQLGDFESRQQDDVTCHCARREDAVRRRAVRGLSVRCDARGDYEPVQCVGSQCHCVDPATGSRRRQPAGRHVSQLAELDCGASDGGRGY